MSSRRKLFVAAGMLVGLLVVGTAWFRLVESFSLLDALYQTVITLSTVGYQEDVPPLDTSARIFTMVFILVGIGVMFYVASIIVEELVLERVTKAFGLRSVSRKVRRMRDHYVVCGYGRIGAAVAEELQSHDVEMVIIDEDEARVAVAREQDLLALVGDATEESMLTEAHTDVAAVLLTATESDAENTFIVLTARAMNPDIFIVAVARSETAEPRMRAAGANRVISLHRITGRRMALAAVQPLMVEFFDTTSRREPGALTMLADVEITNDAEALAGKTLAELCAGFRATQVLGLERADGELLVGPGSDTELRRGDRLMLYGDQREIETLSAGRPRRPVRSATLPADSPAD